MAYAPDADTVPECDGTCCGDFTLNKPGQARFPKGFLVPLHGRHFTCAMFKDGKCSVYPTRPAICREYPDELVGKCPHCGGTMTMRKEVPDGKAI